MLTAISKHVWRARKKLPIASLALAAAMTLAAPATADDLDPAERRAVEIYQLLNENRAAEPDQIDTQLIGSWRVRDAPYQRNFRWVVSLSIGSLSYCVGSLIDPEWVLTSGVCASVLAPGFFDAVVGSRTLSTATRRIDIAGFVVHPDFVMPNISGAQNLDGWYVANDIALVKLATPINDLPIASPATPAQAGRVQPGWTLGALGWGTTTDFSDDPNASGSDDLRQVRMRVWPQRRCVNFYDGVGNATQPILDDMMCAGLRRGGRGTCNGDAGGPFTMRMQGNPVVVGVANWPIFGCGLARIPPTFTRVGNHYDWIQQVLGGDFNCNSPDIATLAPIRELDFECHTVPGLGSGTGLIPIGFPVRVGDTIAASLEVTTEGHLVPLPFPPYPIDMVTPSPLNTMPFPVLAPFWTDINVLGEGFRPVNYGQTMIDGKRAFVVNWQRVGFHGQAVLDQARNAFQLIITESSLNSGNVQVEINYGQIQFDSPDGGTNVARAGFVLIPGDPANTVELVGSGVSGDLVDGGPNALTSNSNVGVNGRYVWDIVGGRILN